MGQGIKGKPNQYEFGYDFDYSVWPAGTKIELVNVAWNNDYRDIVMFDTDVNIETLDQYIDSLSPFAYEIENLTHIKPGAGTVRINTPHSRANRYNYLRVSNPSLPVPGGDTQKNYYYFINDVRYISGNTTELVLQLDVIQTYIKEVKFGRCYVERGHLGMANNKRTQNFHRDYLTVPEGLDVGGEYREVGYKFRSPMTLSTADILVVSTVDLRADAGSVTAPILVAADGAYFNGMGSGASMYLWRNVVDFRQWLYSKRNQPWVTQGIISVTMIPDQTIFNAGFAYNGETSISPSDVPAGPIGGNFLDMWQNWRSEIRNRLPDRYRNLDKFLTYPYTIIEFTTSTGAPIVVKPESWRNHDATIREMGSFMPPNQRVTYLPQNYNDDPESPLFVSGDFLSMAVHISNFPTLPIVNDMAVSYLASNTHSIGWQKANAEWTQSRALGMAQGQYDIASGGMSTTSQLAAIQRMGDIFQTGNVNRTQAAQAIVGGIGSVVGGGAMGAVGGPAGAGAGALIGAAQGVTNGIQTGIQIAANDEALAIRNNTSTRTADTNVAQQGLVRDTNKGLADWAARGDYATQIDGINAKVQDAAMIQPSVSGQAGGEAFNLVNQIPNLMIKWKMIDESNIRAIGDVWLRYGYKIRTQYVPPESLMVMNNFTYWKMLETYIASSTVPEGFKQVIRGIFEKGVTVWGNPRNIGVIDWANNAPLTGVSY